MAELLIELLSEEIPARMQEQAARDFQGAVVKRLQDAHLAFEGAKAYVTPRRLALVVEGLAERQPDRTEERKGPRVGAPDKAVEGFLRAAGLASLDQCEQRTVGKAEFWFAVSKIEGQATAAVLPAMIADAIRALPWPKSMRWADGAFRYVRPLQRINVVFGGQPLAGSLDLGGGLGERAFGAETEGHRFMARGPIPIENFAQYKQALLDHKVMLDQDERKAKIAGGLETAAAAENLALRPDPGLLNEVTGLVEWPVVLVGRIDREFMDLPPEVLTTSMREHQKYFALETTDGRLAPRFAVVANRETADGGKAVVAGNERVLRARLSDAKFFWDQDRRHSLASRVPALENVVFHARLGTLGARTLRIAALAGMLAKFIPGCEADKAMEAGTLAKADLTSGMVGEFPELQGVMGRYYARGEGLNAAVADAIAEHYAPQGPNDACPTAPVSVAVALAEKIDTLVGFFAIDEKPTGSRDPFALRRAALGVIRLILENGLRLPLRNAFLYAHEAYGGMLSGEHSADETASALLDFFADRLKVHLREQRVRHDRVAAVFNLEAQDDLVRLMAQVAALSAFLDTDDGANLLTAYRRAGNIVAIEEKKDGARQSGLPDERLFAETAEAALADALNAASAGLSLALKAEEFDGAMELLARLRGPTDAFFDQVTVNADDPALRANRLKLLGQMTDTMSQVADFAVIEG
ncbi:MAG: glycine--tRNA ligase subunit beta [Alphaproteobacteria bacterium]|nr:glycine--tRNA ligase subunit beta [Alphaproteobacteria bacterium]MCB9929870.1 glycine--tRNA ligase subunit beta [Alphaproteobacteria bacterium]